MTLICHCGKCSAQTNAAWANLKERAPSTWLLFALRWMQEGCPSA